MKQRRYPMSAVLFAEQAGWTDPELDYALHLVSRCKDPDRPFTQGDYDGPISHDVRYSICGVIPGTMLSPTDQLALTANGRRIRDIFMDGSVICERITRRKVVELVGLDNAERPEYLWSIGLVVVGTLRKRYWMPDGWTAPDRKKYSQ